MTFFSIALVLIFVLYLIDKHNAWKGAAKIAAGFVVLGVLGAAAIYGWGKYEDWRAEKKHEVDVTACMKTITEGAVVFVRTGDEVNNVVKSFCESHPGANIACGIKTDSDGNLTTYAIPIKVILARSVLLRVGAKTRCWLLPVANGKRNTPGVVQLTFSGA